MNGRSLPPFDERALPIFTSFTETSIGVHLMQSSRRAIEHSLRLFLASMFLSLSALAQQTSTGTLGGQITDELGAVIIGAQVTAVDAKGNERTAIASAEGEYSISGLAPGAYTVRVRAAGFAPYEIGEVSIVARRRQSLDIKMRVELGREEVTVAPERGELSIDPEQNAGALRLRGADLDVLSDDPDQLAEDLRTLVGPSEGPNGTQFSVDGFSGGQLPSKASIREVRINANQFAPEQDFFGLGRVEIITKPGADKLRGQAFMNFNDESLNARNPFAPERAPFQSRILGGSLSGPITAKKSSFFLDYERRDIDENAVISANILDAAFNVQPFSEVIVTPQHRTNFSARFDYQINSNHTLTARYNHLRFSQQNAGVGGLVLSTRAFDTARTDHVWQLTETAVLSPTVLNESRFQFVRSRRRQEAHHIGPTTLVLDAFIGGGAQVREASNTADRYELQNTTTWIRGRHTWKAGGRLRHVQLNDILPANFDGTFVFTSLEQYREVLRGSAGARPTQFIIAGGNPRARVSRSDLAAFVQDDWNLRPNLTLSYGLRLETQTNISDHLDLAPRLAFAWAPGTTSSTTRPKTVVRGGVGIFYFRFEETLTLESLRFNGVNQNRFIINNPDFFPNIPTAASLADAALPQTTRRVAEDLQTPYVYYAAIGIERQLPRSTTLSVTYIYELYRQQLRSRSINAPLPGSFDPSLPASGVRPFGHAGNIFLFESGGNGSDNTIFINLRSQLHKKLSLFGQLGFSRETSDTESAFDFPANSYDLEAEYGPVSYDAHIFGNLGMTINLPYEFTLSPLIRGSSATSFNITTGQDLNGDAIFTDRPAFASDLSKPGVVITRFGAFDPNVAPGQRVIPRNFGEGFGLFLVNLRLSKTFTFGDDRGTPGKPTTGSQTPSKSAQPVTNRPSGSSDRRRYGLTLSIQAQNIFNHTNYGAAIGNLSSPLFGQANSTATSPRRIDLQVRLSF